PGRMGTFSRAARRSRSAVAKMPRRSIACPMFMEAETDFISVSLIVKPAMAIDMNSAPRRLGERATSIPLLDFVSQPYGPRDRKAIGPDQGKMLVSRPSHSCGGRQRGGACAGR